MKQNLDRETTPEYHLTVQVTDGSRVSLLLKGISSSFSLVPEK